MSKTKAEEIRNSMRTLGVYRVEFEETIKALALMLDDLDEVREQFEASGGNIVVSHTNKSGATNLVKNPLYLALEGVQDRILKYSNELGLTPKGLRQLGGEAQTSGEVSPLVETLKLINGGKRA